MFPVNDLARSGWKDPHVVNRCVHRFYDHLARGLYDKAYDGAPADLAEVRNYVDGLRQESPREMGVLPGW